MVGETFPDETNVGAGVIAPYPTKVVSTVTEFDGPGELVQDTIFNDLVKVRSDGWTFVNCVFRGPSVWTAGSNLVWVDQARVTPAGKPVFKYCDVNPQTADTHWNGIGWKLYRLEQCNIWGAIDCLAAFAREDDPDPRVHIEVLGTWLHDMAQFKPDIAGDRDVTHNDLIQCQGNDGPADDILLDGCRLDAYASTEQGSPQPPEHTQLAAVMMTPNQQDKVCLTLRRSGSRVGCSRSTRRHRRTEVDHRPGGQQVGAAAQRCAGGRDRAGPDPGEPDPVEQRLQRRRVAGRGVQRVEIALRKPVGAPRGPDVRSSDTGRRWSRTCSIPGRVR